MIFQVGVVRRGLRRTCAGDGTPINIRFTVIYKQPSSRRPGPVSRQNYSDTGKNEPKPVQIRDKASESFGTAKRGVPRRREWADKLRERRETIQNSACTSQGGLVNDSYSVTVSNRHDAPRLFLNHHFADTISNNS